MSWKCLLFGHQWCHIFHLDGRLRHCENCGRIDKLVELDIEAPKKWIRVDVHG